MIQRTIKKIGNNEATALPLQNRVDKKRNNCVDEIRRISTSNR